jgi:hypothetical protein
VWIAAGADVDIFAMRRRLGCGRYRRGHSRFRIALVNVETECEFTTYANADIGSLLRVRVAFKTRKVFDPSGVPSLPEASVGHLVASMGIRLYRLHIPSTRCLITPARPTPAPNCGNQRSMRAKLSQPDAMSVISWTEKLGIALATYAFASENEDGSANYTLSCPNGTKASCGAENYHGSQSYKWAEKSMLKETDQNGVLWCSLVGPVAYFKGWPAPMPCK